MTRYALVLIAVVCLFACNRGGERNVTPMERTPLVFGELWLHGTLSFERNLAKNVSQNLPLTLSLKLTNPSLAMRQLGLSQITNAPCHEVRLLYRREPNASAQVLGPNVFHLPALWSDTPKVCFYVGMEWSRRFILDTSRVQEAADLDGQLVVSTGEGRSSTEQVSVIVTRPPASNEEHRDFERRVVARSNWISLNAQYAAENH